MVIDYADTGEPFPGFRERVEPGAFTWTAGNPLLNVQHSPERLLARDGAGLALVDGPEALRLEAELPATREADDALALVRAGVLTGLSVEFFARRDRQESDGLRVIEAAELVGVALVARPAFDASTVAARHQRPRGRRRRVHL